MNRLTPERLREIEDMELPRGKAVIAIAELLDEVRALRAELAGAAQRRISCVHSTGMCSGPTLHFNWPLDAESRAAVDSYHQAMIAHLAGAEERGRQRPWTPELASDMATLYEYMLDKSPRVDKFRVMFEVGQRLLVRTGTAAADAGEPTPSADPASTASAGCPGSSQPATRPGARQR